MRIYKRDNGKLVLTSRITLIPGPHDRLIELIVATPRGQLAPVLRELLRRGLEGMAQPNNQSVIRELLESDYDPCKLACGGTLLPSADPAWPHAYPER